MSCVDSTPADASKHKSPFKRGMFFGLGFSIPFLALFWAGLGILVFTTRNSQEHVPEVIHAAAFGPDAGLRIVKHRAVTGSASLYVVGVLANTGKESWDTVTIVVRLFDANGEVVGLCKEGVWAKVRPGSQIDFQVDCDKWDTDAFPKYQRYSVEVGDARPEVRFGA